MDFEEKQGIYILCVLILGPQLCDLPPVSHRRPPDIRKWEPVGADEMPMGGNSHPPLSSFEFPRKPKNTSQAL